MKFKRVIKVCLLFSTLFFSLKGYGQNNSQKVNLQWNLPGFITIGGDSIRTLRLQGAFYNKEDNYLPSFQSIFYNQITSYKISNPVFQTLTEEEKNLWNNDLKLLVPKITIDVKIQNKRPVSFINILPFKYDSITETYQKLISFDYSIVTLSSTNARLSNKNLRVSTSTQNSVLASGEWYKLRIAGSENSTGSGIYKIDYPLLTSMGIDVKNIDPRKIKIFGNGGMLPQLNSAFRYDDLIENSIYISGEEDSTFDQEDYILFYAQGPHTWSFDSTSTDPSFYHNYNLYSDYSYYFLTVDKSDSGGKRVQEIPNIGGGSPITVFDDHVFHELDRVNILGSGREWYGETFQSSSPQSFSFQAEGTVANSTIKINSSVLGRSPNESRFDVRLNGSLAGTQIFNQYVNPLVTYQSLGDTDTRKFFISSGSSPSSFLNVSYTFNNEGISTAIGNLNFLEINFLRQLALYGNQTSFRSIISRKNSVSEFALSNALSDLKIWDITDIGSIKNQLYSLSGTQAKFSTFTSSLKEFIAFSGNDFGKPQYIGTVPNQNLHAITSGSIPDMVIVTIEDFKPAADRLALFRKSHDNLDVQVVTLNQIYNEFSSGGQDISAVRDFMRMLYERSNSADSLSYLLLFGACSYDYKNRIGGNTNIVPIYESRESLHNIDSHSSDDYFGFLDPSEGNWEESSSGNELLDIGIGRLPVKTPTEADQVVNKLINYSSNPACMGKWRNKITFIGDDEEGNLFISETGGAEALADIVNNQSPTMNINKLYIDAYPQEPAPGGETSPIVKAAIDKEMEKGNLFLNYSGHGGESQLAQEKIVDLNQIASWTNYNNLPFFITATCEFGRYDDPNRPSGAELCLLSNKGGTIGLLSSTRPVYASSNYTINSQFYIYAFKKINGKMPRLGDISMQTKNHSFQGQGINNRNFGLLCDPSLRLAYPEEEISITQINDSTVSTVADTTKALSKVSITGEVRQNGIKMSNFNGSVYLTFYDKELTLKTLGSKETPVMDFKLRTNFIYDGAATVENGTFKISFIVPKDISYQYDTGKISMYAKDSASMMDAGGYYSNIIIGGSMKENASDNTPPKINLFMGDKSFVSGGLVSPDTRLIAVLNDENGINISSTGIGHEISAVLDNSKEVIILNEFYSAEENNYKVGTVNYPFNNLSEGKHTLTLKAWDVYNNSSTATIEFLVSNIDKLTLDHIYNYPNPFSSSTTFQIDHNRQGQTLKASVEIYNLSGQLIKVIENTYPSSPGHIDDLKWDQDIPNSGLYLYKVTVHSLDDGAEKSSFGKLMILH